MIINLILFIVLFNGLKCLYISNDITCTPNKVIPHPSVCSSFIKCGKTDESNIILNCTYPTLFNKRKLDCDMPERVICQTYNFVFRQSNEGEKGVLPKQGTFVKKKIRIDFFLIKFFF